MNMFAEQQQWQAQRLGKFTGSCAGKLIQNGKAKDQVFSVEGLKYIWSRVAEIMTGQPTEDLTGMRAIEWGHANEYDAVQEYINRSGFEVEHFGGSNPVFFPHGPFAGCSPDGIRGDRAVVEAKCPYNSAIHAQYVLAALREREPAAWLKSFNPDYYAQIQFNALCLDAPAGVFISFDPRVVDETHRLAVIEVPIDEPMQALFRERLPLAAGIVSDALQALKPQPLTLIATAASGCVLVDKA